jgi:hypothetical protein
MIEKEEGDEATFSQHNKRNEIEHKEALNWSYHLNQLLTVCLSLN